ncbi:MAG: trigger factor, partial [Clostridia bacterium]|nr:trigger factor [Clostridia bacterium]
MSLNSSKLIDKNLYELKIGIDAETFGAAVNSVYKRQAKNITVPGFRKGKAPRSIIEKMYGKGVFYEDAINALIPDAYESALKESGIDAVGQPEFDVESVDENGVVLVAKVYVKPEVKIEGYKGIEVTRKVERTTAAEVKAEIDRVRDRNSRMIDVEDRAAKTGDTANIDYEGFVDGVAFDGGKGEGYDLILGSGQFIPGFEDQIVGHNIGDEFDVVVTFPADYHAEELAGKEATFKTKLNGLKLKELPAADDEFARDVSDFDTFAEYEADVKAKIKKRKEDAADSEVEGQLIDALMEKLDADIPEVMFAAETENFVRDYDTRLRMQGLDLKTYFQYTGMTLDSLREQLRPQAEKQVKTRLALEKIAELEAVAVSDDEVEAEYTRLAEAYGMEADKIKETVAAEDIAADLKVKKAVDLVKAAAVIKKPAAKKAEANAETAEEKPAEEKK